MSIQGYEGVWIDHSYSNSAAGLILTLPASWGSILISALTIAVTTAGACTWTIVAYAIHQYRSRGDPRDALFLQEQVILRNAPSAPGTIWELFMLVLTWKAYAKQGRLRLFGLLLAPLLVWSVFTAAGIFVGKVATPAYKTNNILLAETDCGVPAVVGSINLPSAAILSVKSANDSRTASAYVDNCYGAASGALGCSVLAVQSLAHNESFTECPFGGLGRCISPTLTLDSGLIDSNSHLGINAKAADRVLYRLINTCSILHVRDLVSIEPDSNSTNGQWDIEQFFLGPRLISDTMISNSTYTYATRIVDSDIGYTLSSVYNYGGSPNDSVWIPVADLSVPNADVTLAFFGAGAVRYLNPVLDPLFSANGTYTSNYSNTTYYLPDQFVNVMACTEQRQYCNGANPKSCTGLAGYQQAYNQSFSIGFNDAQTATAGRINNAAFSASTYNTISGQGPNALQANKRLYNLVSPGLPKDQWILEASHWFQTILANFAHRIVDFPTNSWNSDPTSGLTVRNPQSFGNSGFTKQLVKQCGQQRVQSTDAYMNFSFLGVLVIIILTPIIVIVSWTLDTCVSRYRNRRATPPGSKRHKLRAAVTDGKLSLLRMALEGAGYKGWEDAKDGRPWRNEVGVGGSVPLRQIDPVRESKDAFYYKYDAEIEMVPHEEGNGNGNGAQAHMNGAE